MSTPVLTLASDRVMGILVDDVLASISTGLVLLDVVGRVALVNQGAEDLTGIPAEHAVGRTAAAAFAMHPWLATTLASFVPGDTRRMSTVGELLGPPRSLGKRVTVRVSVRPVLDAGGSPVGTLLLLDNVAAQRQITDGAERAPRASELAVVAAGLAHEIKNPLGGIKGAAQLLGETLAADPESLRFTELITQEVDRVSALLEQLLELTRPVRLRPSVVNVHRILRAVLDLTSAGLEPALTIRCDFDPSLPEVWADEAQLRQVFLNLVKNAIEAMAGAGTLTIVTRWETDFRVRAPGETGAGTQFLYVEIADTGPGIQPEDCERMFTPFFTTKSQGTGLGLPITDRIVRQHGGRIHIDSEPGRGTCIRVSLPVVIGTGST